MKCIQPESHLESRMSVFRETQLFLCVALAATGMGGCWSSVETAVPQAPAVVVATPLPNYDNGDCRAARSSTRYHSIRFRLASPSTR